MHVRGCKDEQVILRAESATMCVCVCVCACVCVFREVQRFLGEKESVDPTHFSDDLEIKSRFFLAFV